MTRNKYAFVVLAGILAVIWWTFGPQFSPLYRRCSAIEESAKTLTRAQVIEALHQFINSSDYSSIIGENRGADYNFQTTTDGVFVYHKSSELSCEVFIEDGKIIGVKSYTGL